MMFFGRWLSETAGDQGPGDGWLYRRNGLRSSQEEGDAAIKAWIDQQLHGTSVTAVLIGSHTCSSKYVQYEIDKSIERGNGLLEAAK